VEICPATCVIFMALIFYPVEHAVIYHALSFYILGTAVRFVGLGHTRLARRSLIAQGVELVPLGGHKSVTARGLDG
jgi:hypothetical protein